MVTWHISTQPLKAKILPLTGKSGNIHEIRALKYELLDSSSGEPESFTYQNILYQVRETLNLSADAEETEWDVSATSGITVTAKKGAEVYTNGNWISVDSETGVPAGIGQAWKGGSRPQNSYTASLAKVIDKDSGNLISETRKIGGKQEGDEGYDPSSTENGVSIRLSWDGDKLKVEFEATGVPEDNAEKEVLFEPRSR
jgi:hypothetical protein